MPLDQWSAVALDSQIRASSSNPIVVKDHAVALWRSASGAINAWEDRCPHRGMRLSLGFVEGDRLRCIYHGWGYGSDGQCKIIPAHPELTPPKTICANRYAAQSRYGLIWTNLAQEPTAALPDLGADEGWVPVRSIYLDGPAVDVQADITAALAQWGTTTAQGDVVTVVLDTGTTLTAAFHPIDGGKTGVHVVARGLAADDAASCHALADRVVQLRTALETN